MGTPPRAVGNYRIYERIGTGGMGSVHLGRLFAPGGFRRIVAIKRLHPQFAEDLDFVTSFLDEARLASRVHHRNVVAPLDVVSTRGEVFLVFEHILGASLAELARRASELGEIIPTRILASLMSDVLHGLHAAHEATDDDGAPLGLIHRDVSPQNILVGKDGTARLLDFGIAKATGRLQSTNEGVIKGKRGYMAPEHLLGQPVRASDVYSAAVVLWELLTNTRLFADESSFAQRLAGPLVPPTAPAPRGGDDAERARALLSVATTGLAHAPERRYPTARAMAIAIEEVGVATSREVGEWIEHVGRQELAERTRLVAAIEAANDVLPDDVGADPTGSLGGASIAAEPVEARPRKIPARPLLAAFALLALAFGGVLWLRRPATERTTISAPTPPPPQAVVEPAPPAPSAEAPSAEATGVAASPRPTAAPVKRPAPKRTAACKPWVIDKEGHKRFNEECLR